MNKRKYHIDSIEYLITDIYIEGKSFLFNLFFGWEKTDSNNYAFFHLRSKDWKIIDIGIKYYYTFVKKD